MYDISCNYLCLLDMACCSLMYNDIRQWAGYNFDDCKSLRAAETLIARNNGSGDVINRQFVRYTLARWAYTYLIQLTCRWCARAIQSRVRLRAPRIHATVGLCERKSLVTKCRGLLTRDNHRWVSVLSKNRRAVDKSEVSHFIVRSPESCTVS